MSQCYMTPTSVCVPKDCNCNLLILIYREVDKIGIELRSKRYPQLRHANSDGFSRDPRRRSASVAEVKELATGRLQEELRKAQKVSMKPASICISTFDYYIEKYDFFYLKSKNVYNEIENYLYVILGVLFVFLLFGLLFIHVLI